MIFSAVCPVMMWMPLRCRASASRSDVSSSRMVLRMRSFISIMVTSTPRRTRASVTLVPMSPPPMTTARTFFRCWLRNRSMALASSSLLKVKTPLRSEPGVGGKMGVPPVASSSFSQASVSPLASATVCPAGLTLITPSPRMVFILYFS